MVSPALLIKSNWFSFTLERRFPRLSFFVKATPSVFDFWPTGAAGQNHSCCFRCILFHSFFIIVSSSAMWTWMLVGCYSLEQWKRVCFFQWWVRGLLLMSCQWDVMSDTVLQTAKQTTCQIRHKSMWIENVCVCFSLHPQKPHTHRCARALLRPHSRVCTRWISC